MQQQEDAGNMESQSNSGKGAIFPLTVNPGSKAYQYHFQAQYSYRNNNRELQTIRLNTVTTNFTGRELCNFIFNTMVNTPDNFQPDATAVYDGKATIFVNKKIHGFERDYEKVLFPEYFHAVLPGDGIVHTVVSPHVDVPEIDLDDLTQYEIGSLLLSEDTTVKHALAIILTQKARVSDLYTPVSGYLYSNNEDVSLPGFSIRKGVYSDVKIVKTDNVVIQPAVVVDIKKSLFYRTGNFLTILLEFKDRYPEFESWTDLEKVFNGVRVSPVYHKGRVLTFTNFTDDIVRDLIVHTEGGQLSMSQFYLERKNIKIMHLEIPAGTCGNYGDFPLELLDIVPNQRVNVDSVKIPAEIKKYGCKKNQWGCKALHNQIMAQFKAIFERNEIANKFGISVDKLPTNSGTALEFERLEKPEIFFGNNEKALLESTGGFLINENLYFQPAVIKKWTMLISTADTIEKIVCEMFKQMMMETGRSHGIEFYNEPDIVGVDQTNLGLEYWDQIFAKCATDGSTFILYLREWERDTHSLLKLMETRHQIVTQDVAYDTVCSIVKDQNKANLENILLKTNVKNGGVNYKVVMDKDKVGALDINSDVLVIGYDVSPPAGMDAPQIQAEKTPSAVGISFNTQPNPSVIVGDFFFQPSDKQTVARAELRSYMTKILEQLQKNRSTKKLPKIVVVFRNDLSEKLFSAARDKELAALREGCAAFSKGYKPKFLFIAATKQHHKRFFHLNYGKIKDPHSGSCVDSAIVRPDCLEFYMKAHKAFLGSAKFVQFAVLVNETDASSDHIKNFVHCCCYGHQAMTCPISLPAPIFIAGSLAKRGLNVYQTFSKTIPQSVPKTQEIDFKKLSEMLNYLDSKLSNVQFTA